MLNHAPFESIYTIVTISIISFMSIDMVEINTAMDLIKEDIIKELSESIGHDTKDDVLDNISYDS